LLKYKGINRRKRKKHVRILFHPKLKSHDCTGELQCVNYTTVLFFSVKVKGGEFSCPFSSHWPRVI
jgi:hypothetical protein